MLDVLLVDDEPSIRLALGDALRAAGHRVTLSADGEDALRRARVATYDVVISDIRLPKLDGLSLFRHLRQDAPQTDVILITAYGQVTDAVQALKEGAVDYLTKPFDTDEILMRVQRIANRRNLEKELASAREALASNAGSSELVVQSATMIELLRRVDTIAASEAPVLITGESGTGKELVARRLHQNSARRSRPFVAVNCAVFPETLLEAELFGHERGAFTGAVKQREGRFKAADGGTIFLDEIAEMPLLAQAKLLRVLQEGTIEPLGSDTPVAVDVRVVSATHRNLKERIAQGLFRDDLYYRIKVLEVPVPPLRERRGDLPVLVAHFLRKFTPPGRTGPKIGPRAWAVLSGYAFPGNVRELEHAIQHAVVLAGENEIDVHHLPQDLVGSTIAVHGENGHGEAHASGDPAMMRPLASAMREFEREYLLRVLEVTGGARTKAAELLGISRKNLWEKLRAHHISDDELEP